MRFRMYSASRFRRGAPKEGKPAGPSTSGAGPVAKSNASWPVRKSHGPALTAYAYGTPLPASPSTERISMLAMR